MFDSLSFQYVTKVVLSFLGTSLTGPQRDVTERQPPEEQTTREHFNMGRVARYKKVKNSYQNAQFGEWGYGENGQRAKKRSLTVRKLKTRGKRNEDTIESNHFDAPPDDEDEFDLSDLNVVKEKPLEPTINTDLSTAAATSTLSNTHEEHKLLKSFETDLERKPKEKYAGGKLPGESKHAYRRRTSREVQQIIHDTKTKSKPSKTKRKTKHALNAKKLKKKGMLPSKVKDLDRPLPVEAALERRAVKTQAKFGEQAERPPIFKQLPRGAEEKIKGSSAALELLRNKAQAQYALLKAKRKKAGEGFHL